MTPVAAPRDYEYVAYEQDGSVVTVTFDRPERLNTIGMAMSQELTQAWTRFPPSKNTVANTVIGGRTAIP